MGRYQKLLPSHRPHLLTTTKTIKMPSAAKIQKQMEVMQALLVEALRVEAEEKRRHGRKQRRRGNIGEKWLTGEYSNQV